MKTLKIGVIVIGLLFLQSNIYCQLPKNGIVEFETIQLGLLDYTENIDIISSTKSTVIIDLNNHTIKTDIPKLKSEFACEYVELTKVENTDGIATLHLYYFTCKGGKIKFELHYMPYDRIKLIQKSDLGVTKEGINYAAFFLIFTDYIFTNNLEERTRKN